MSDADNTNGAAGEEPLEKSAKQLEKEAKKAAKLEKLKAKLDKKSTVPPVQKDKFESKSLPLLKEETMCLLTLLENSKILKTKSRNNNSNLLKIEEWDRVTALFNEYNELRPRTAHSLRLKWENLKKAARKRSDNRIHSHNTRSLAVSNYCPPTDEILDRVSSILENAQEVDGLLESTGEVADPLDNTNGSTLDTELCTSKSRPLSKAETKYFVSLVGDSDILKCRATDAVTNKLKNDEWERITREFNERATCPRRSHALRLKWENIKKCARKRSARIRQNNESIRSGVGPSDYIPPDEVLDRVAELLGCAGDEPPEPAAAAAAAAAVTQHVVKIEPHYMDESSVSSSSQEEDVDMPVTTCFEMNHTQAQSHADGSVEKRNIAMTEYYTMKKKMMEAKFDLILQKSRNVKLENEKLRLELKYISNKLTLKSEPGHSDDDV